MDPIESFKKESVNRVNSYLLNDNLNQATQAFVKESIRACYCYNFSWLGRPVIQYPQDLVMMQEIIWEVNPDLIIETGIAHGGSIIFYASILELLGGDRKVIGIDVDIRQHNRKKIEEHQMFKRIKIIEGSSTNEDTINQVKEIAKNYKKILVCLDSLHTYEHVLKELKLYSSFVTKDSYLVVFDTYIENHIEEFNANYPYHRWNNDNPKTAVEEFLKTNDSFVVDRDRGRKLLITAAPGGYLKRIK